jgi:hypothetical protein
MGGGPRLDHTVHRGPAVVQTEGCRGTAARSPE